MELDEDSANLDPATADALLADQPLIAASAGSIPDMKALRARCLAAGIPAAVGCPPGAGKGCGGARTHLLVAEADLPRLGQLLRGDWHDHLAREGLTPVAAGTAELTTDDDADGEPPCPACGTAAALVDGACADCGLALA